jgi:hypothetical protein
MVFNECIGLWVLKKGSSSIVGGLRCGSFVVFGSAPSRRGPSPALLLVHSGIGPGV